jgi:hypothetical protein
LGFSSAAAVHYLRSVGSSANLEHAAEVFERVTAGVGRRISRRGRGRRGSGSSRGTTLTFECFRVMSNAARIAAAK